MEYHKRRDENIVVGEDGKKEGKVDEGKLEETTYKKEWSEITVFKSLETLGTERYRGKRDLLD